jgi:nucleoside phosphorylase
MAGLVVAAAREELGELEGEAVGVGPIVAGVHAAALIERLRPSWVVLIGTAGAYPGGPPIGSVVAASRVGWGNGVAMLGLGYVPRPPGPVACDLELLSRSPPLERRAVLTVGAITTDPALARRFAETGWAVEHLEAYPVGFACREAGIPFVAVFGIANDVGPDAHVQWLANRDAAQDGARRAIAPIIAGG